MSESDIVERLERLELCAQRRHKIARSDIEEVNCVPEMADRGKEIAFTVAKRYLVFGFVLGGCAWMFHYDFRWPASVILGLFFAWLYDSIRELRWCVERLYYAVEEVDEDDMDNRGFAWAREPRPRSSPRRGSGD